MKWNYVFLFALSLPAWSQAPSPAASGAPADVYHLQPGDSIEIRFFYDPQFDESVQLRPDGRFSMALIGEVGGAGKTVAQLSSEIQERYAKQLRMPAVEVQVKSYSSQRAYVTGEVAHPGVIALQTAVNVLAAISEAGGVKESGNRKWVVLIRKSPNGRPTAQKLPLFVKGDQPAPETMSVLQPWDVVIVPASRVERVGRWVDEYIRRISPANLVAGFQYLYQPATAAGFTF